MLHRITIISIWVTVLLLLPLASQGALLPQPTGACPTGYTCKLGKCVLETTVPTEFDLPCNYSLEDIVQAGVNFVTLILGFVGGLALLIFFLGGFWWLTSSGNPEQIEKGKKTLTGGIIGLMIVLGAAVIVQFTGKILGVGVKPTGEVEYGKVVCPVEARGTECGENMVCYKGACIAECDYKAATEEAYYGYSCQIVTQVVKEIWECTADFGVGIAYEIAESKEAVEDFKKRTKDDGATNIKCESLPLEEGTMICEAGLCPGGADYKCCITAARKKLIEGQKE